MAAVAAVLSEHEASNILRRLIRILGQLQSELGWLRRAARMLDPEDLRKLAREVYVADHRSPAISELRGLARSIIRYGGPDAVRRDADPVLVEALNRIWWQY